MAVTLKIGLTLSTLVKSLWTADQGDSSIMNLVVELEASGYSLKVSPSNITIVYTDSNGDEYGASSCEVKADLLVLVVQGKVGYSVKVALRQKINTLIDSAHQWHQQHSMKKFTIADITADELEKFKIAVLKIYGSTGAYHKVAAIKKVRELVDISLHDAKKLVEKWVDESNSVESFTMSGKTLGEILDEHDAAAAAIVIPVSLAQENPKYLSMKSHIMDLADAKHLHQAVYGTSIGSRYYVIALGDDARVAVRIKNANDISIKAICTKAPQSKAGQEVTAGFERASLAKAKGGHWSLHLNPTSMVMAERSIGSTLFAMGIPFWAVTGQLSVLAGK